MIESPQLAPTLVATAVYNGIIGSPVYGEGSTLELDGTIDVKGHTPVRLDDLFAPTDQPMPAGFLRSHRSAVPPSRGSIRIPTSCRRSSASICT